MKINPNKIKSIKIFGKTYLVKFVDSDDWSMNGARETYCGRANHSVQQILVRKGLSDESTLDTILHEVVHCISQNLGMGISEEATTQWATALTDLLLSNAWRA